MDERTKFAAAMLVIFNEDYDKAWELMSKTEECAGMSKDQFILLTKKYIASLHELSEIKDKTSIH